MFSSAESMILLGSIERTELQAIFDWWLSPERRVFERGQNSPGQGSKVSWESFSFVDEEGGEESTDKVWKTHYKLSHRGIVVSWVGSLFTMPFLTAFFIRLLQCRKNVMDPSHLQNPRSPPPITQNLVTWHIKNRSTPQMSLLSPLTCVVLLFPQTSASCHQSGGRFRDSSPPRLHQAKLKLRYATTINHGYSSNWPPKHITDPLLSLQWQFRQWHQSTNVSEMVYAWRIFIQWVWP